MHKLYLEFINSCQKSYLPQAILQNFKFCFAWINNLTNAYIITERLDLLTLKIASP